MMEQKYNDWNIWLTELITAGTGLLSLLRYLKFQIVLCPIRDGLAGS
jgi:hypothetical protein